MKRHSGKRPVRARGAQRPLAREMSEAEKQNLLHKLHNPLEHPLPESAIEILERGKHLVMQGAPLSKEHGGINVFIVKASLGQFPFYVAFETDAANRVVKGSPRLAYPEKSRRRNLTEDEERAFSEALSSMLRLHH